jgi:hypothetical protein
MIEKKKLFYKFNDINTKVSMGDSVIGLIKNYIGDPTQILWEASTYQILIWGAHIPIPTYLIIIFVWLKGRLMILGKYLFGIFLKKTGFWKAQSEFSQEEEHLAPFNAKLKMTIISICQHLGIKDHF